jgi:hypothetical protein
MSYIFLDNSTLYIYHMLYSIGGVIYLAKKIIRWWYFTCKNPENIVCDGILHVNVFHYFKTPYFTCNVFIKFTYNEYIGPYFLSHVVLRFLPSDLLEVAFTYSVGPLIVVWRSELGPAPPHLFHQWECLKCNGHRLSVSVCEVALNGWWCAGLIFHKVFARPCPKTLNWEAKKNCNPSQNR